MQDLWPAVVPNHVGLGADRFPEVIEPAWLGIGAEPFPVYMEHPFHGLAGPLLDLLGIGVRGLDDGGQLRIITMCQDAPLAVLGGLERGKGGTPRWGEGA